MSDRYYVDFRAILTYEHPQEANQANMCKISWINMNNVIIFIWQRCMLIAASIELNAREEKWQSI